MSNNIYLEKDLPTEMIIGDRSYEIMDFQRDNKKPKLRTIIKQAKKMGAHLSKDDIDHLLDHQGDIPVALQNKVKFIFIDWKKSKLPCDIGCVFWLDYRWTYYWYNYNHIIDGKLMVYNHEIYGKPKVLHRK